MDIYIKILNKFYYLIIIFLNILNNNDRYYYISIYIIDLNLYNLKEKKVFKTLILWVHYTNYNERFYNIFINSSCCWFRLGNFYIWFIN